MPRGERTDEDYIALVRFLNMVLYIFKVPRLGVPWGKVSYRVCFGLGFGSIASSRGKGRKS